MKCSSEVAGHILYFLLSCSSLLDCGLVPFAGRLVASPSIEAGSVAMVLLVNTGKAKGKREINQYEHKT